VLRIGAIDVWTREGDNGIGGRKEERSRGPLFILTLNVTSPSGGWVLELRPFTSTERRHGFLEFARRAESASHGVRIRPSSGGLCRMTSTVTQWTRR
jgi:hypothetical protein